MFNVQNIEKLQTYGKLNTMDKIQLNILVINLDERVDRLDYMTKHLSEMNQQFIRISAVCMPFNGGRGCSLSHAKALLFAKEKKWDKVLILEDDASLRKNFETSLETMFCELPENWMAVFLGPGRVKKVAYNNSHSIRLCQGDGGYLTGSHAIIYRDTSYEMCIKALMDDSAESLIHTDLILSETIPKKNIFIPVPFLADFIKSRSNIRENSNLDLELLIETENQLINLIEKYEKIKLPKNIHL